METCFVGKWFEDLPGLFISFLYFVNKDKGEYGAVLFCECLSSPLGANYIFVHILLVERYDKYFPTTDQRTLNFSHKASKLCFENAPNVSTTLDIFHFPTLAVTVVRIYLCH